VLFAALIALLSTFIYIIVRARQKEGAGGLGIVSSSNLGEKISSVTSSFKRKLETSRIVKKGEQAKKQWSVILKVVVQ
jgi:hypothetical protein